MSKKNKLKALNNSKSKVNIIIIVYIVKLDLKIWFINFNILKTQNFIYKIFSLNLAYFLFKNKLKETCFFSKLNLLADINVEVILKIFFLIFNNANRQFKRNFFF